MSVDSLVIVPVSVYYLCVVVLIFHRFFLFSFEILLGRMSFCLWFGFILSDLIYCMFV